MCTCIRLYSACLRDCRLWRVLLAPGQNLFSSPSLAADGGVLIGCPDGRVTKLAPDTGAVIWNVTLSGGVMSPPSIDAAGTVFVSNRYHY